MPCLCTEFPSVRQHRIESSQAARPVHTIGYPKDDTRSERYPPNIGSPSKLTPGCLVLRDVRTVLALVAFEHPKYYSNARAKPPVSCARHLPPLLSLSFFFPMQAQRAPTEPIM